MGWEQRSGGLYYYRKRRVWDRVISEYIGPGVIGQLTALLDEEQREERELDKEARKREREVIQKGEAQITETCEMVRALTGGALLGAGYHTHKGQWRKRRNE